MRAGRCKNELSPFSKFSQKARQKARVTCKNILRLCGLLAARDGKSYTDEVIIERTFIERTTISELHAIIRGPSETPKDSFLPATDFECRNKK